MEGIKGIFVENTEAILWIKIVLFYAGSIILILLFNQIHIILHELGHFAFGLMTGFRFLLFRIGKHVVMKTEQEMEYKKLIIRGSAGQCLMMPSEKRHWFWYNAGGIIMNLATGSFAWLLSNLLQNTIVQYILFWFGFVGIFLGLQNAIPRTKKVINDGATIKELRNSAAARNAYFLQLKIVKNLCNGVRYRDMDIEKLKLEEENYTSDLCAYINLIRYYHFLDRGERKKAEIELQHLEVVEAHLSLCTQMTVKAERFYIELLKGSPNRSQYFIPVMDFLADDYDINLLRIRYQKFLDENNIVQAAACYAWSLGIANDYSLSGEGMFNLELMKNAYQDYQEVKQRWTTSDGS